MHSLLKRQLKRHFSDPETLPDEFRGFIDSVDQAYSQFDTDRNMVERSLELSSHELLQANSEMRAVFQALPDLFVRLASDGTILDINGGTREDFYIPPEKLVGKRFQDIPEIKVAKIFDEMIRQVNETKTMVAEEYSLVLNNEEHFYEARLLPLMENQIIGIVGKITERKLAEKALLKNEALLRATIDSTADGILVVDENGSVINFNTRFVEMWRIPDELLQIRDDKKLLGFGFFAFSQLQDPPAFFTKVRELHDSNKESFDILDFNDGRVFERYSFPLMYAEDNIGRVWNFRDITERKYAEDLQRGRNKILEQLATGVSLENVLTALTETAEEMQPGMLCSLLLLDDEKKHLLHASAPSLPGFYNEAVNGLKIGDGVGSCGTAAYTGKRVIVEDLMTHPFWAKSKKLTNQAGLRSCWSEPIISSQGEIHGTFAMYYREPRTPNPSELEFIKTTANLAGIAIERKKSEEALVNSQEQLRQSQKMQAIGTLAGGIAHDFNNILWVITGNTEMSLRKLPGKSPIREKLQEILSASVRAKSLIEQILTFSRQAEQEKSAVDVHIVLQETLRMLESTLPATIAIQKDIDKNTGCVLGDPTQIHQMIMNFGTNAYHAIGEKRGILAVSLGLFEANKKNHNIYPELREGNYIQLTISDTGCGMDQATIERIFEPFFTTKAVGVGTGLGLSTVHGIVSGMEGVIRVSSKIGEGTSFRIFLPRIENESSDQIEQHQDLPDLKGTERILVVDDEKPVIKMVQNMLEELNYTVTTVTDSKKALTKFKAQPDEFDLVITDQTMPELTGLEMAEEMLHLRPDLPVILASGFNKMITEEQIKNSGIREYIKKPIVFNELETVIRKVLDEKEV